MSDKSKKPQKASLLREVAPKKKHGLSVPRIKYPHEDYLKLVDEKDQSQVNIQGDDFNTDTPGTPGITSITGISGITGITGTTGTTTKSQSKDFPSPLNKKDGTTAAASNPSPPAPELHPVSPVNNFTKTPNSVTKIIQAQGLFRGKSKQIYDYLWSVSRGAINPKRVVRKTHGEIKAGAGLGSRNTVLDGLKHLAAIGIIRTVSSVGVNEGNEYEIYTPEELGFPISPGTTGITGITGTTGYTETTGNTGISQNLVIPVLPESGTTGIIETTENKDAYGDAKTFLKTKEEKRIDDEPAAAFRPIFEKLNEVFKDVTGREATSSDEAKLAQLGELIAAEFVEAASRTKVVSDPAAFLLTHLRRRLGVRTIKVETLGEKETGKGNAASAKPTKREIQLTDDEIQECPDCQGRLLIYPGGPSKGAVMCNHQPLIKAKQGGEQKAEEGKVIK